MGKFFLGSKYIKFLFLSVWNNILHLLLLVNFYSPFKSSSYQTPPTFRKWFSLIIHGKTEIIIWGFLHLLIMNLQTDLHLANTFYFFLFCLCFNGWNIYCLKTQFLLDPTSSHFIKHCIFDHSLICLHC